MSHTAARLARSLAARARLLRATHHVHHLREVGFGAGLADFERDRALAVHRAGDNLRALALLDRLRLAGEHRLVEARRAGHDHAVGRHALAGLDQHRVTGLELVDGHLLNGAVRLQAVRFRGQQAHQRLERPGGAHHGAHLDPVAEEHHVD
ncbi:MAG: hypothetical protein M5U08_21700 [Burkholderiales bacterium]|nr:hypothetical protein [Burkholderiales bacterium]